MRAEQRGGAFHDRIVAVLPEERADHGVLGEDRFDARLDAPVALGLQDFLLKAGAVVIVYVPNALLYALRCHRGGVHGEIAALRVSADGELTGIDRGRPRKIVERVALRRDLVHDGEQAVLLPADDRIVRAAEGHIVQSARQTQRERGELLRLFFVMYLPEAGEHHLAEAHRFRQTLDHRSNIRRAERAELFRTARGEIRLHRLRQRNVQLVFRHDAGKIERADLAVDVVVHLVRRRHRKRHVAAPGKVIENVRHSETLFTIQTVFSRRESSG